MQFIVSSKNILSSWVCILSFSETGSSFIRKGFTDLYFSNTDWIEEIGVPIITFQEPVLEAGRERRVLFSNGLEVDFCFDSIQQFIESLHNEIIINIVHRGMKIILDKSGDITERINNIPVFSLAEPPTLTEYNELNNVFWFRAQWAARRLRRGELWVGKRSCDFTIKELLLKVIEWHSRAINNWNYDTWHRGSFLEEWASPVIIEKLKNVYAHYDENDAWNALTETVNLFRSLSLELADILGYDYPVTIDEFVSELINEIRYSD